MEKLIDLLNDCSIEWFRASIKERQKEMDTTINESKNYGESAEAEMYSAMAGDYFDLENDRIKKIADRLMECDNFSEVKDQMKSYNANRAHEIELMVKKSDGYNESNEFFAGESTAKVLSMIENDFFNDIQGMIASVDKVYKNLEKLGLDTAVAEIAPTDLEYVLNLEIKEQNDHFKKIAINSPSAYQNICDDIELIDGPAAINEKYTAVENMHHYLETVESNDVLEENEDIMGGFNRKSRSSPTIYAKRESFVWQCDCR
jgi:hypothetical protein